uniref:MAT1-1-4 n=1 Tax=Diplodia sapinea TaxID=66738 RepID=V5NSW1_9PEZI|nr:MAT1-1-4 [Diplodia sapinea]
MNGMSSKLWKPTHGLIPIEGYLASPVQLDFDALQRTEMEDDPPGPPRGSPEHISRLLMDLDSLRDLYVYHSDTITLDIKELFQNVMEECLDLLNPPDSIHDVTCRTEFFKIVREVAVQVTGLIEKRAHLRTRAAVLPKVLTRLLEKSNGYQEGLPRWSQFLCFNAPGAMKLRVHDAPGVLQTVRRGYQVVPQGGIGILRNWDAEIYRIGDAIDQQAEYTTWSRRFEWGSFCQHKLALGVRRFDPCITRPSPWSKDRRFNANAMPKGINLFRQELEVLDQWIDPFLGLASDDIEEDKSDYHLGLTLFKNIWTYDEMKFRQDEDDDAEAFGFVVVQRFIRDEDLERLREFDSMTAEQRNQLMPAAPGPNAASSSQAGPSTAAGPQAGSSAQAASSTQP